MYFTIQIQVAMKNLIRTWNFPLLIILFCPGLICGQVNESKQKNIEKVIINGHALSSDQLADLEGIYGVKAQPGDYWYDSKSGMYGLMGQAAYGFMHPDHIFGKLDHNASNGNTGVVVNGRELPQTEWAVWSQVLGYWIQPGRYWLDAKGNAGYEGNPYPVVNLYLAASQSGFKGNTEEEGRFWATRFSSGNSYAGNQTGYVSLPGGGIVGYDY